MPYTLNKLITSEGSSASTEKRLSICLDADGFSFSESTADGCLLSFGHAVGTHAATMTEAAGEIRATLAEAAIKPLGYKHMDLVVVSNESLWVPDELYSSTAHRQYMRLVGGRSVSLLTCHSAQIASTAVFAADEHIVMAFKVALPGIVVMHQHARVLDLAPQSKSHPLLFTHWRKGRVDIAAFRAGKYLYGNTLSFANEAEAQFRVLEVMKAYDLESGDTELLLCGDVDRERFAQLRPYFPKVTLYNGRMTKYTNPEFRTLHTYRYALVLM